MTKSIEGKEINMSTLNTSAPSNLSLFLAHPTPVYGDIMSSFTTLGDESKDVGYKVDGDCGEGMITPPMSQKEQNISSPPSPNSKVITRNAFVDSLISAATILLESVWPKNFDGRQIKWFLKESLRRSRSSYCTLQVSLYYIYKLKPILETSSSLVFQCPKRCFLTCLILASKFLQDRNYSMKTWSKLSGLPLKELILMEIQILKAIDYDLNLNFQLYSEWSKLLLVCTYVNNTKDSTCDESDKTLATLLTPTKRQQLAQIFVRFDQKMRSKTTNATSLSIVYNEVVANNTKTPSKRKLDVLEDQGKSVKLIRV